MPLFIKTAKNIFGYAVSQYEKNSAYALSLTACGVPEWVIQHQNNWNEVELQLFEKMTKKSIKRETKYVHDKLKRRKNALRQTFFVTTFRIQYCNTIAVLKVDSI